MPISEINRVRLFYETTGSGAETLIFVHGSWADHTSWNPVISHLSEYRIITYDRRGHSQSERPSVPGNTQEDVSDFLLLIEQIAQSPVHAIGNSFGGVILLKAVVARPDLLKTVCIHEPPFISLLNPDFRTEIGKRMVPIVERIKTGDRRNAAMQFVETVALGPGWWDKLTPEDHNIFTFNADTFADEVNDPESLAIDLARLEMYHGPILITMGDQSPPFFERIIQMIRTSLKQAHLYTIRGAGHIPHVTHPEEYSNLIREFVSGSKNDPGRIK